MHSENMPINDSTAHGVERLVSSKELVGAMDARTLAETALRSLYILVHKVFRHEFGGENLEEKIGETWITTDPDVWLERDEANIKIGMSQGENLRKTQALSAVMEQQAATKESNPLLVSDAQEYQVRIDFARASGLPFPDKYWVSPQSDQGKQAKEQQTQDQAKAKKMEEDMHYLQMALEKATVMIEKGKSDGQNQVALLREQLDRAKAAMAAAESDENLRFDYVEHFDDMAMQLTSLETQYDMQILDFQENKEQVSE
jgi:hypothetical protein